MQVVPYVQPRPRGVKGVSATVSIENAESTPVHEVILRQHSDEVMTKQVCACAVHWMVEGELCSMNIHVLTYHS